MSQRESATARPPRDDGWRRQAWTWLRPRVVPIVLLVVGVGLALFVAYRSQGEEPPSAAEAAFLALSSSVLSIFAGSGFARIGRADPTLARSAVRRLFRIGVGVRDSVERLDSSGHDEPTSAIAETVGRLSTLIPVLNDAIQDWNEVHPEALREVMAQIKVEEAGGTTE